jgi:hypothetical protein
MPSQSKLSYIHIDGYFIFQEQFYAETVAHISAHGADFAAKRLRHCCKWQSLRKAAQQQLGDAHALDKNLVTISSADGEQAYLSGQLAGSPFQQREVAAGGRVIFHTQEAFGPVGAGVVAIRQSFYDQYPEFVKKLY